MTWQKSMQREINKENEKVKEESGMKEKQSQIQVQGNV